MHKSVPSSDELNRLRSVGATSFMDLRATKHAARSPLTLVPMGFFVVFGVAMTYQSTKDSDTGWPWTFGAAAVTLLLVVLMANGFRQGVVLDEGRIGVRRPLRPGTVWVDLDQVDLVIPGFHIGVNLRGARGPFFRGPAGHYFSVNLWSQSQGFSGFIRWGARRHLIPRQRRFVDDAETHLGYLRVLRIDQKYYERRAYAAIVLHLRNQLPARQAEQLRDLEEYSKLLHRWAQLCFEAGGRNFTDWRRDPRTLDVTTLDYGPGYETPERARWWHRFDRRAEKPKAATKPKGPFG